MQNIKAKLIVDHYGYLKNDLIAKSGDVVEIVSKVHDPVWVVKDKKGNKFSINKNKLNEHNRTQKS